MADVFTCPKCKKEFDTDNPKCEADYMDDGENENGEHKWDVGLKCPYCSYEFYEEIWDDFGNE